MSKTSASLTNWRRDKVWEYVSENKTPAYISDTLQIPLRTIYRDIHHIEKRNDNFDWLDKKLPLESRKGLKAYDMVASYMWDIVTDTSLEPRDRINAANAVTNATDKKLNLIRGKDTLKRTVTFITKLKQQHEIPRV